MAETMYYHIGQLVDERDASVGVSMCLNAFVMLEQINV